MKKQADLRKLKRIIFVESKIGKTLKTKEKTISILKQDQFDHENKTWERSLDFYKQENASLKTRLSIVTDTNNDKEFIKLAEYFQTQFLLKDQFIKGLKVEINRHNDEIKSDGKNRDAVPDVVNRQEILRKQISYFETDFSRLKNEFYQVISQFV